MAIGKKVKVNDYKFIYGQETVYMNIYSVFKNTKNGNKYIIYGYDNNKNKLFYGTFFQRNNEAVIMTSKEDPKEIVREFITSLLEGKFDDKFEIVSLDELISAEVIDEYTIDFNVDINKLYDLTIPKPKPVVSKIKDKPKKRKHIFIAPIFFGLFIVVVIVFFFVNPEVIIGKNRGYSCIKNSFNNTLFASVKEEISLVFNGKGKIISIDLTTDYVFNNTDYYKEFKDKNYFYQYIDEGAGDTYKFVDEDYTYRLFSEVEIDDEYFLSTEESELVSYYSDKGYVCKVVEVDE